MTITLRNTVPDEQTAEGIRYYFYDAYAVPLPAAADARGEQRAALEVRPLPIDGEPGFRAFQIGFPQLRYEHSRTIELTITLTGQPPRSDDPTRIGPSHATFPVFGPGDPGRNTVEVVAPAAAEVESTVASFEPSDGAGGTVVRPPRTTSAPASRR